MPVPLDRVDNKEGSPDRRSPQHDRGRRRVDAILDAASAILVEDGIEGLTIESIARRSRTAKSSMYHFFSDRDSIVDALAERHIAIVQSAEEKASQIPTDWSSLSATEVVDRILDPFHTVMSRHPDVLPVMMASSGRSKAMVRALGLDHLMINRIEEVLVERAPRARPSERRVFAAMAIAMIIGSFEVSGRFPLMRAGIDRELHTSLRLGFTDFEARHAR